MPTEELIALIFIQNESMIFLSKYRSLKSNHDDIFRTRSLKYNSTQKSIDL